MARSNRLRTLQRLAEFAEAEAARRLADELRSLADQETRLTTIRQYLADYAGRTAGADSATTVGALRGRRHFTERLQDAAAAQNGAVTDQRRQVDQQTARWRSSHSRAAALDRYADRLDQREDERRARREQTRLDEVGSRRPLR